MTLRTVTATTKDTAGEPDNTKWVFCSELRGADGEIITTRPKTVKPVAGQLTVQLEPGPTIVMYGGRKLTILVPDEDADLWELLEAAIAYPPDTSQQQLNAAVGQYVESNSVRFRTRAVPVSPADPDTLYQWVDAEGTSVGTPVPLSDIVAVGWGAVDWGSDGAPAVAARKALGTLGVPTDYLTDNSGDYMVNDVVRFTDPAPSPTTDLTGLYACLVDHTSGSPRDYPERWVQIADGPGGDAKTLTTATGRAIAFAIALG